MPFNAQALDLARRQAAADLDPLRREHRSRIQRLLQEMHSRGIGDSTVTGSNIVQAIRETYRRRADAIWDALQRAVQADNQFLTAEEIMASFNSTFDPEFSDALEASRHRLAQFPGFDFISEVIDEARRVRERIRVEVDYLVAERHRAMQTTSARVAEANSTNDDEPPALVKQLKWIARNICTNPGWASIALLSVFVPIVEKWGPELIGWLRQRNSAAVAPAVTPKIKPAITGTTHPTDPPPADLVISGREALNERVDADPNDPLHCNVKLVRPEQKVLSIDVHNPYPGINKIKVECVDCGIYTKTYEWDIRTLLEQRVSMDPYLSSPGKIYISYGGPDRTPVTSYQANGGCRGGIVTGLSNVRVRITTGSGN